MQKDIREALRVTDTVRDKNGDIDEQRSIFKDRREIDLLSVLSTDAQKILLQTETKAVNLEANYQVMLKDINKGIVQLGHFKDYLQRMHGTEVNNFWYSPAVALPNLSICLCNPGKRVAEMEISDNQTADQTYHGKKYHICPTKSRGFGCNFFKWDCDVSPWPECDLGKVICECGNKPITIEVPPPAESKKSKKPVDPQSFQICQHNGCDFFRWNDHTQNHRHPANKAAKLDEQTFGNSCSMHFLIEEHIANKKKRERWWEANCKKHTGNSASPGTQIDSLKKRLLMVSSMVFTRIPRLLCRDTPDSMLILMR